MAQGSISQKPTCDATDDTNLSPVNEKKLKAASSKKRKIAKVVQAKPVPKSSGKNIEKRRAKAREESLDGSADEAMSDGSM